MAINILFDAVHDLASSVKAVVARLELCGEGVFFKLNARPGKLSLIRIRHHHN